MSVSAEDLRAISLFAKFDDSELADVCQAMRARDYPARAIVFAQGERSPGLWIVRCGRVRLLSRVLANHSRHLRGLSSTLALRCSMPRLGDRLLTYAHERGCATERGVELNLDISHELLGTVLGMTAQMIACSRHRLRMAIVFLGVAI